MLRTSLPLALLLALPAAAQDCDATSVGLVPLPDLVEGSYLGHPGGLYPGGTSHRPPAHDQAGLAQAALVVPRDASGVPAAGGRIVLLSIGMSHTTAEFQAFTELAASLPLAPAVTLVDGAQGGVPAEEMVDPAAPYWDHVDQRLAQAGVTAEQVQAVWLKQTNAGPSGAFPAWAEALRDQLAEIVRILRDRFPNLRLGYVSGRSYAGYATTGLNPEPYAYETSFAVRWLLEDQIDGDPGLNYDPARGPVEAPWLAWGPYLWADGLVPRSDGLVWACEDFVADGTHLTPGGWTKAGALLRDALVVDATARSWLLAGPQLVCGPQATTDALGPGGGPAAPSLVASALPTVPTAIPLELVALDAPPAALGVFAWGVAPLPPTPVPGGLLLVDPLVVEPVLTDGHGQARLSFGALPEDPALCGGVVHAQFGAQHPLSGAWELSRALRLRAGH